MFMELRYDNYVSPMGTVYIVFNSRGIARLTLAKERFEREYGCAMGKNKEAVRQLGEYFDGERKEFSLPLQFNGTPFQKKVWTTLEKIPYGETRSYEWVAEKIGKPKAVRAVGNAVGANPLPIIIPCHRVIRKNGELGGYGYGAAVKEKLLKIER